MEGWYRHWLDILDALTGQELAYYIPLDLEPLAQHVSGQLQTTVLDMKCNSNHSITF
jgi:hypothetical protein